MSLEDVVAQLPHSSAPPLVTEAFGHRTVLEMELALQKACEVLQSDRDNHDSRCFIARQILARVGGGERTFGGMVSAGIAAVENLNRRDVSA
jgi:hypothetical protein